MGALTVLRQRWMEQGQGRIEVGWEGPTWALTFNNHRPSAIQVLCSWSVSTSARLTDSGIMHRVAPNTRVRGCRGARIGYSKQVKDCATASQARYLQLLQDAEHIPHVLPFPMSPSTCCICEREAGNSHKFLLLMCVSSPRQDMLDAKLRWPALHSPPTHTSLQICRLRRSPARVPLPLTGALAPLARV